MSFRSGTKSSSHNVLDFKTERHMPLAERAFTRTSILGFLCTDSIHSGPLMLVCHVKDKEKSANPD